MTFLAIYTIAAAISLGWLLHHVRLVDRPAKPGDILLTLVVCVLFAAMWPSLLAGILAGRAINGD